jgi:hypothetical protein
MTKTIAAEPEPVELTSEAIRARIADLDARLQMARIDEDRASQRLSVHRGGSLLGLDDAEHEREQYQRHKFVTAAETQTIDEQLRRLREQHGEILAAAGA